MRFSAIFLMFSAFIAAAAAAVSKNTYYHAMQLVWAWDAYQVDLGNHPSDRSIGFSCTNWQKDHCEGEWEACRGSGKGGSCGFSEFIAQVTENPEWKTEPLLPGNDQKQTRPDILETAKHLYLKDRGADIRPWHVLKKDLRTFNTFTESMGMSLYDTRERLEREGRWSPELQSSFDRTIKGAKECALSRKMDLDRFIIPEAEAWFKKNGMQMDLSWETYPDRPQDKDGQTPRIINWDWTARRNPNGHVNVAKFLAYRGQGKAETVAIESHVRHRTFIISFERSEKIMSGVTC